MLLAFPASMSTQARLNMRIIITGLAIDKNQDGYEVTAQIVKTTPGSESSGTGATINFISDTGNTLVSAISKLSYKAGKVAGFSHTNFILLGKSMLDTDLSKELNYFVKDNIIKDSVLVLVAKDSAKDEIMKTKDVELSVGLGLQKVFMYKEKESDGIMTTLLSFMNKSADYSKTAVASVLSLNPNSKSNDSENSGSSGGNGGESEGQTSDISGSSKSESENSEDSSSQSGSSGGSSEKQSSSESGGSSEQQSGSESGGSSGESGSNGGSQGGGSEYQYFDALTPIVCFVEGKHVGSLESQDEIMGYLFTQKKSHSEDMGLENVNFGQFKNARVGIDIKNKTNKFKIRYEQDTPCLDIYVKIKDSEVKEIQNDEQIYSLSEKEFGYLKDEIKNYISQKVAISFTKAKEFGADIFGAFDLANKFFYKKTKNNFSSMNEFLSKLKLNVIVSISRLEY